jgi:hypothetical protein
MLDEEPPSDSNRAQCEDVIAVISQLDSEPHGLGRARLSEHDSLGFNVPGRLEIEGCGIAACIQGVVAQFLHESHAPLSVDARGKLRHYVGQLRAR